jgi:preprotein translocase subunit SecA
MENLREIPRKEAYECDITYGTNNEFGFDYLRDNMAASVHQMVQRPPHFAIVDEVDSILIDEARTPLIISAPDMESTTMYQSFARIVPNLKREEDYTVDEKMKAVSLTEEGIDKVEKMLGMGDIYEKGSVAQIHHLEQALKAEILFKKDKDYVIKDGEVMIVDDFTGRLMPGRRFSEGLHQAIEAKENVKVQRESRTLATITFQNYFRLYNKLAGMTGTALTSAEEFSKVYDLDTLVIPSNKSVIRKDLPDSIYKTEHGKFKATIREIEERYKKGQPVLVGTIAIEKSELLSQMLTIKGLPHKVLNAKYHEKEAQIISQAGQRKAITIATNMAGRGTDIKLEEGVAELGGLHIIGTERHEARRIDNQLRGRSGRQGEPGSTQFFVSMEDHLMRVFGSDKMKAMMDTLGIEEDMPIENKLISRSIESAQSKIEGYNFDARKHVLDYDDVMNKQREVIYNRRREILKITKGIDDQERDAAKEITRENYPELEKLKSKILEVFKSEIQSSVAAHTMENRARWNLEEIIKTMKNNIPLNQKADKVLKEIVESDRDDERVKDEITGYLFGEAAEAYEEREKEMGYGMARQIEKAILLRNIDLLWMEHLDEMQMLRDGIGLRGYGQRDPLIEYKKEGYRMFQNLLGAIDEGVFTAIFKVRIMKQPQSPVENKNVSLSGGDETAGSMVSGIKGNKVGRNDPCPCGSGKKYKKCCGKE